MTIRASKDSEGRVEIWTNCEPGDHFTGRCLASADTFEEAKRGALFEIGDDVAALASLREEDVHEDRS